jgi:2',3'-cyclic-nucleotide 2'-phosphodiesterase (5'-nucleotidase family)
MKKLSFFVLLFIFGFGCKSKNYLADEKVSYYRMSQTEIDSAAERKIAPYRKKMQENMDEVVGVLRKSLIKGTPESTMGNWLADLIHQQSEAKAGKKIDITLLNLGGLRIPSLPEGKITRGNIFELLPFENTINLVELDSATVVQLFQHIAKKGGWPMSHASYLMYNIKVRDIKIGGLPLSNKRKYTVALPDYIANGGDNTFFLKDLPKTNIKLLLRDATLDYMKKQYQQNIIMDAELDDRVLVVNE